MTSQEEFFEEKDKYSISASRHSTNNTLQRSVPESIIMLARSPRSPVPERFVSDQVHERRSDPGFHYHVTAHVPVRAGRPGVLFLDPGDPKACRTVRAAWPATHISASLITRHEQSRDRSGRRHRDTGVASGNGRPVADQLGVVRVGRSSRPDRACQQAKVDREELRSRCPGEYPPVRSDPAGHRIHPLVGYSTITSSKALPLRPTNWTMMLVSTMT